jgi:ferritin-like metal-binding protein YciE
MQIAHFRDMYIAELQELRNAEMQLTETWRQAAEISANPRLTNIFVRHGEETQLRKERLDGLLLRHGADRGRTPPRRCRPWSAKPKR